ncbi:MAG: hypothetical protein H0U98_15010 [Alphaproteobacteria bacterium]|nr:hypothetical protein [Alphaproteobacteria bacterium]
MAYSAKKHRMLSGGAVALGLAGMAMVAWLTGNHADPGSLGLFRVVLALVVVGIGLRGYSYMDEVQRQAAQKRWFWGSLIGIAAMLPLVVFLQTHKPWLDTAVQFIFHQPAKPALYFNLRIGIPVMFQCASVLVMKLLDKLRQSSAP